MVIWKSFENQIDLTKNCQNFQTISNISFSENPVTTPGCQHVLSAAQSIMGIKDAEVKVKQKPSKTSSNNFLFIVSGK